MTLSRLTVEFVTPCFLGGARPGGDRPEEAGWRGASVRGQLRWWLRAVAGGAFAGDLGEVRALETRLFGSTAASSALQVRALGAPGFLPVGAQPVWGDALKDRQLALRWGLRENNPEWRDALARLEMVPVNPLVYLGYGVLRSLTREEARELPPPHQPSGHCRLTRSCIAPDQKAMLQLTWRRPLAGASDRELWEATLWCWLNLGGIGSRSRRGFGSLRELPSGRAAGHNASTRADFVSQAREKLEKLGRKTAADGEPEWSHFSDRSRIFVAVEPSRSWDEALVRAGGWLIAFRRRYGYPKDGRTLAATPLADRDYVWAGFKQPRKMPPDGVPDRAGFGLPLPFGKKLDQVVASGDVGDVGRRASPLLLHVARLDEGFFPVFTHLPARLAPDGSRIRFVALPKPAVPPTPLQREIVTHFLDDLAGKKLVESVS